MKSKEFQDQELRIFHFATKLCIVFGFFASIPSVWAGGGWISAGGLSIGDSRNPWFIREGDRVRFCIRIDSASVSASESELETAFRSAWKFWQEELVLPEKWTSQQAGFFDPLIAPGRQSLEKIKDCDGTQDVSLLAGSLSLDREQKEFLNQLQPHIGITVRTDYDRKFLKARGFIYLSSDLGPGANLGSYHAKEGYWKNTSSLLQVLKHELGHVHGLSHSSGSLMAEHFPDQIIAMGSALPNDSWSFPFLSYPKRFQVPNLFGGDDSLKIDFTPGGPDVGQQVFGKFGIPIGQQGILLQEKKPDEWEVSAYTKNPIWKETPIGKIRVTKRQQTQVTVASWLVLPKEQVVLREKLLDRQFYAFLFQETVFQGTYEPLAPGFSTFSVRLQLGPKQQTLLFVDGGEIKTLFHLVDLMLMWIP